MRKDLLIPVASVSQLRVDEVTLLKRERDVCGEIVVGGKNITRPKDVGFSCSRSGV